jgi:tRNA (guanine37-N1)-methyltransferase
MNSEKLHVWIVSLFPDMFQAFLEQGLVGQLLSGKKGESRFHVHLVNPRGWGEGVHKAVDDTPFGGGPGMVMRADILWKTLWQGVFVPAQLVSVDQNCEEVDPTTVIANPQLRIVNVSPSGVMWTQAQAESFCTRLLDRHSTQFEGVKHLVFLAGRYEGIDQRLLDLVVSETYCIGDYVLTGGEVAIMALLDSALRLVPGTLGNPESIREESFQEPLLEAPVYTKPRQFFGTEVPEVLLSGHHLNIKKWQKIQQEKRTQSLRPDLWRRYLELNQEEKKK